MTNELRELKEHVRWLEDEVSHATAVDECLEEIDRRLGEIDDTLEKHDNELTRLVDAFNRIADAINRHSEGLLKLLEVLVAPKPQPSMGDVFGDVFKPSEPKKPAAKPKPRKPKLSIVPGDGDRSPEERHDR